MAQTHISVPTLAILTLKSQFSAHSFVGFKKSFEKRWIPFKKVPQAAVWNIELDRGGKGVGWLNPRQTAYKQPVLICIYAYKHIHCA